jgi:uncharacterized protein
MEDGLSAGFRALALLAVTAVPLYALRARGRTYAIFAFATLALALPGALVAEARLSGMLPEVARAPLALLFAFATLASGWHLATLSRARLRSSPFRLLVSVPGQTFLAAGFMAGLWLLALAPLRGLLGLAGAHTWTGALGWLDLAPFALAVLSVATSMRPVEETVRLPLAASGPDTVERVPIERYRERALQSALGRRRVPAPLERRPLRIAQITDPHLGPWQPVHRLHRLVERQVERDPDLVLLTGDFLTMEGAGTPGALAAALAPLGRLPGRCFAIFGNHDHEAPDVVRGALEANGVELLIDAEAIADTPVGRVQLVGADYAWRERREHIRDLLARFPRRPELTRILLLHDPSVFRHVPVGDVDLTLSGHTHGGQVGLVSFGSNWTVLTRTQWPDHGLFGHGSNRLYVHRGTGFYGFPLRVGVPGESSLLEVVLP